MNGRTDGWMDPCMLPTPYERKKESRHDVYLMSFPPFRDIPKPRYSPLDSKRAHPHQNNSHPSPSDVSASPSAALEPPTRPARPFDAHQPGQKEDWRTRRKELGAASLVARDPVIITVHLLLLTTLLVQYPFYYAMT